MKIVDPLPDPESTVTVPGEDSSEAAVTSGSPASSEGKKLTLKQVAHLVELAEYFRQKVTYSPTGELVDEAMRPIVLEAKARKFGLPDNIFQMIGLTTAALTVGGVLASPAGPGLAAVAIAGYAVKIGADVKRDLKHQRVVAEAAALGTYVITKNKAIQTAQALGISSSLASKMGLTSIPKPEKKGVALSEVDRRRLSEEISFRKQFIQKQLANIRDHEATIEQSKRFLTAAGSTARGGLREIQGAAAHYQANIEVANREIAALKMQISILTQEIQQCEKLEKLLERKNIVSRTRDIEVQSSLGSLRRSVQRDGFGFSVDMVDLAFGIASAGPVGIAVGAVQIANNIFQSATEVTEYHTDKEKRRALKNSIEARRSCEDVPGYDDINEIQRLAYEALLDEKSLAILAENKEFKDNIAAIRDYEQKKAAGVPASIIEEDYQTALEASRMLIKEAKMEFLVSEEFIANSLTLKRHIEKLNESRERFRAIIEQGYRADEIGTRIRAEHPDLGYIERKKLLRKEIEKEVELLVKRGFAQQIEDLYRPQIDSCSDEKKRAVLIAQKERMLREDPTLINYLERVERARANAFHKEYFRLKKLEPTRSSSQLVEEVVKNLGMNLADYQGFVRGSLARTGLISGFTAQLADKLANPSGTIEAFIAQADTDLSRLGKLKAGIKGYIKKLTLTYIDRKVQLDSPKQLVTDAAMTRPAIHSDQLTDELLARHEFRLAEARKLKRAQSSISAVPLGKSVALAPLGTSVSAASSVKSIGSDSSVAGVTPSVQAEIRELPVIRAARNLIASVDRAAVDGMGAIPELTARGADSSRVGATPSVAARATPRLPAIRVARSQMASAATDLVGVGGLHPDSNPSSSRAADARSVHDRR